MQKHNVANQREHLILLLANVHIRQFPKPDQQPKVRCIINSGYTFFCPSLNVGFIYCIDFKISYILHGKVVLDI